jgi:hypothetical protein
MRFEGKHDRLSPQLPGILDGAADQRLMTEVKAVEITQGRHRPGQRKRMIIQMPQNFHELVCRLRSPCGASSFGTGKRSAGRYRLFRGPAGERVTIRELLT